MSDRGVQEEDSNTRPVSYNRPSRTLIERQDSQNSSSDSSSFLPRLENTERQSLERDSDVRNLSEDQSKDNVAVTGSSNFQISRNLEDSDKDRQIGESSTRIANLEKPNHEEIGKQLHFTKEEVLKKFGKKLSDLYCAGEVGAENEAAYLISRKNSAYLFILQSVTCLVVGTKLSTLDMRSETAKKFLSSFVRFLVSAKETNGQPYVVPERMELMTDEERIRNEENDPQHLKYTLLEVVLATALFQLDVELEALLKEQAELSAAPDDQVTSSTFERIKKMKEACEELKSEAKAFEKLLAEIQDSEKMLFQLDLISRFPETNASLLTEADCLALEAESENDGSSRKRVEQEAEEMLRYFKQRAGIVKLEAKRLYGHACIFEDSSKLTVAMLNYRASRLRVKLSAGSLVAACGAFLCALFGMSTKGSDVEAIRLAIIGFAILTAILLLMSHAVFTRQKV